MIPFETFPALAEFDFLTHAFTLRTAAATKADDYPAQLAAAFHLPPFATAEQTHGNGVALVTRSTIRDWEGRASSRPLPEIGHDGAWPSSAKSPVPACFPDVDALITAERNLPLLIRCADCAAVFIVDSATPAIGLVHSGKKGTLANIVTATLAAMQQNFGTVPARCRAVISPCIGPCHYELDLWSAIETQLRTAGATGIHNTRTCTACNLDRYFSYRAEKGQTGRMYAILMLK